MVQAIENIALPQCGGQFELEEQLRASPYWALRQLVCQVDCECVIVRGTVPCFYLKQVAQALALKTAGARCVISEIDVSEP